MNWFKNLFNGSAPKQAYNGTLSEVQFTVPKLKCNGCGEKIIHALSKVEGVHAVKPNPKDKVLIVQFVPAKINQQELERLLDQAGFTTISAS